MEHIKTLFSLIGISFLLGLSSCGEEDMSVFGDDFEIPELTDANTIQFTVDATHDMKLMEVIGGGGNMAIEWGDGRLQKVAKTDRETITYKYGNQKTYKVRIWAEDLDFCSVGSESVTVGNLRLGHFPKMKNLALNSFVNTPVLDIGASFPNVEAINIGNFCDLERIDCSGCAKLQFVELYTHPRLTSLKLEHLPELNTLRCKFNDELTSITLKDLPTLRELNCYNNPRLGTLKLMDDEMDISSLDLDNCAFRSLDFLSKLPALNSLGCSFNQLTGLDLSNHLLLYSISCFNNKELTHLRIPKGSLSLRDLRCFSCDLDASTLNTLFDALATAPPTYPKTCRIIYFDNPGANSCDRTIPVKKGWDVMDEPEIE